MATLAVTALVALYAVVVVRTAWICDDAYITLRTIDNFVNGYGLRWNIAERVQAYTHPLWMMLLAAVYSLTREAYYTTLAVSGLVSLTAMALFAFGLVKNRAAALLGVGLLLISKSYIDFSTSGLENPLSHLILVAFFVCYFGFGPRYTSDRQLLVLTLVTAIGIVCRQDLALLFLPPLIFAFFAAPMTFRRCVAALLGATPLFLWESFSLLYYGFLVPNTAYAKLAGGIARDELVWQGVHYYLTSVHLDPLMLLVIVCALAWSLVSGRWDLIAVAIGMSCYLVYVLWIGGDFMSGRLLTAVFLCAVVLLTELWPTISWREAGAVLAIGVAIVMLTSPVSLLGGDFRYQPGGDSFELSGVIDERAVAASTSGLRASERTLAPPRQSEFTEWALTRVAADPPMTVTRAIGFYGYFVGPAVHVVDRLALADPLLSRLPMAVCPDWRVGHYPRAIPAGYLETLESGKPQFEDAGIAEYYRQLSLITRGPLWSVPRLRAIVDMNLGRFDGLIDRDRYRFGILTDVDIHKSLKKHKRAFKDLPALRCAKALLLRDPADALAMQELSAVNLMDRFADGQVDIETRNAPADAVGRAPFDPQGDANDADKVLQMHAGTSAAFDLELPAQPVAFHSRVGLAPQAREWASDGVEVVLTLRESNGRQKELHRERVGEPGDLDSWHPVYIPLGDWRSKPVTLILSVEPDPAGGHDGDWAGWNDPRLIWDTP